MSDSILEKLYGDQQLSDAQYEALKTKYHPQNISLFKELNLLLYAGILLLVGGLGFLIYEHIGSVGHIVSMIAIAAATLLGFYYLEKHVAPFTKEEVSYSKGFLNYLIVLTALLLVTLLTYIQVYFDLIDVWAQWSSLASALIFIYMAYRYDSRVLLSMAIVAFAAFLGFSISLVDWAKGTWVNTEALFGVALIMGAILYACGILSNHYAWKKHFAFTYSHYGVLFYFSGSFIGAYEGFNFWFYLFLILLSALILVWYSWVKRQLLFFLYANLMIYISVSCVFIELRPSIEMILWYFPISTLLYMGLLMKYKKHFNDAN